MQIEGPGGVFIWLRQTSSAFQAEVLFSRFDFVTAPEYSFSVGNMTGRPEEPTPAEVVIYPVTPPADLSLQAPWVFSLEQIPAVQLPFQPGSASLPVGANYRAAWEVVPRLDQRAALRFSTHVFPACPVQVQHDYTWENTAFQGWTPIYWPRPSETTLGTPRVGWWIMPASSGGQKPLPALPEPSYRCGRRRRTPTGKPTRQTARLNTASAWNREQALLNQVDNAQASFAQAVSEEAAPGSARLPASNRITTNQPTCMVCALPCPSATLNRRCTACSTSCLPVSFRVDELLTAAGVEPPRLRIF